MVLTFLAEFASPPAQMLYISLIELFTRNTITCFWFLPTICVPILSYIFLAIKTTCIKHKKIIIFYPLLRFLLPIFQLSVEFYTFLTFRQRTWGGPRFASKSITENTQLKLRSNTGYSPVANVPDQSVTLSLK